MAKKLFVVECARAHFDKEVDAETPHEAIDIAMEHLGPGWMPVNVSGDDKSVDVIGECEACGGFILEGDEYDAYADGVKTCCYCRDGVKEAAK